MFDQLEKPCNFGVNDKPPCTNCDQPTSLIRRSPDYFDRRYERQIFACFKCSYEIERVVDADGNSRSRRARDLGHPDLPPTSENKVIGTFSLFGGKWERVMSAKSFRECANECMGRAKIATSVKERRSYLQMTETCLRAADQWEMKQRRRPRPNDFSRANQREVSQW
jgi:hypothetical protein